MPRLFPSIAPRFLLACVVGTGCRSATEPTPSHPVYDLTAKLTSFSWETGGPSLPDCPSLTYCHRERPFEGAELVGTITFGDTTVQSWGGESMSSRAVGYFGGKFCDKIDAVLGCLHVTDIPMRMYAYGSADLKVLSSSSSEYMAIETAGTSVPAAVFMTARADGDSIYGTLSWTLGVYRSPPTHHGTFVARLRK